jgi:hypothetical protein
LVFLQITLPFSNLYITSFTHTILTYLHIKKRKKIWILKWSTFKMSYCCRFISLPTSYISGFWKVYIEWSWYFRNSNKFYFTHFTWMTMNAFSISIDSIFQIKCYVFTFLESLFFYETFSIRYRGEMIFLDVIIAAFQSHIQQTTLRVLRR